MQSDRYNQRIANTVIAQITTNLKRQGDPAHLLVETATPAGQQSAASRKTPPQPRPSYSMSDGASVIAEEFF